MYSSFVGCFLIQHRCRHQFLRENTLLIEVCRCFNAFTCKVDLLFKVYSSNNIFNFIGYIFHHGDLLINVNIALAKPCFSLSAGGWK